MSDNAFYFIDSNILLYSIGEDAYKQPIAEKLTRHPNAIISTQVLNEFCNVVFRKKLMTTDELVSSIEFFTNQLNIINVDSELIIQALTIKHRYHHSYWDSLIMSASLKANATTLYSEDMHHGQIIDHQLTIINPFQS